MPLYSFKCEECGEKRDRIRKIENRDEPEDCPKCEGKMIRVIAQTADPIIKGWHTPKFHR